MDIYDFIKSRDVANHCRVIGHEFNSIEMAVIINKNSWHKTLAQKHKAYREIITNSPDMHFHESLNIKKKDSLHRFLQDLIAWELKLRT